MTRPVFTFIDAAPVDKSRALQIRRKIRSHVAKAAPAANVEQAQTAINLESSSSLLPAKSTRRKRRRPCHSWTVQLEGEENDRKDGFQPRSQPEGTSEASGSLPLLLTSISGTAMIPASQSPVFHQPFVSVVMDNYLQHLAVAIPEIDGEGQTALLKARWFPLVLNSPTVFQVIVLFSASHYASYQQDLTLAETLLSLKQCALADITKSLASSSGNRNGNGDGPLLVNDELIAATAKMASYEAIYGDEAAYHSHMNGVAHMLRLRGGLSSLGLEGFLSRLLVFIDTNSAFLLKTHLHLSESSFPRLEPFLLPNPSRFIGEVV